MEHEYEETYVLIEEQHPWFVARRQLFAALLVADHQASILDVGCGTEMFLVHLKALGFERLAGVEPSENLPRKYHDDAIELFAELPENTYDRVVMMDVLEHIEDDRGTLARIHRLLTPGGRCYLSVPAHPFLWGHHDEINRHCRRYRRRELEGKLVAVGFRLRLFSYWNMFFFPAICLACGLGMGRNKPEVQLGGPGYWGFWEAHCGSKIA